MTITGRGREAVTWLFVPGSRGDRFDRAAGSGSDEVILDLEDAVSPEAKDEARQSVASWLGGTGAGWVRINGAGTPGHEQDLAAVRGLTGLRGVVVPKAEDPRLLAALREELPASAGVLALVESAAGIEQAPALARSGAVDRLAFGSVDFALDIGAEETDEALLLARSSLVLASRLGALPAPIDGVTSVTTDDVASHEAAVRGRSLGFGGKLCIHPRQVEPVAAGFRPTPEQRDWAARVLEAADDAGTQGAFTVDGVMVDRPVLERARSIMVRSGVRP
jgi:citrate lyase subunit beta/citryl-CoA lyase